MTSQQTVTEATAHQLITSINELKISLAVTAEKLQTQSEWNQEQKRLNIVLADKLAELDKVNVSVDQRVKKLEEWKGWVSGVLTSILIVVLVAVVSAGLYMAYGVR